MKEWGQLNILTKHKVPCQHEIGWRKLINPAQSESPHIIHMHHPTAFRTLTSQTLSPFPAFNLTYDTKLEENPETTPNSRKIQKQTYRSCSEYPTPAARHWHLHWRRSPAPHWWRWFRWSHREHQPRRAITDHRPCDRVDGVPAGSQGYCRGLLGMWGLIAGFNFEVYCVKSVYIYAIMFGSLHLSSCYETTKCKEAFTFSRWLHEAGTLALRIYNVVSI